MDKKPLFGLEKKKLSFRVNSALQGEVFSLSLSLGFVGVAVNPREGKECI